MSPCCFTATFPLPWTPTGAVLRTPDAAGERTLALSVDGGQVTITVDRLESYDLVELR